MAISVASYTQTAWNTSTSPKSTPATQAWSSGDRVVVVSKMENGNGNFGAPTNANLTFGAAVTSQDTGNGLECAISMWVATAGSSQSGQTISATRTSTAVEWGFEVWVITGSPTGTANITSNFTEGTISRTVSASSIVIYTFADWSAAASNQTGATGSGSMTERADSNSSNYGWGSYDWVGTSAGTFNFGVTSYTGLQIAHAIIEITGPAAATTSFPTRRHDTALIYR